MDEATRKGVKTWTIKQFSFLFTMLPLMLFWPAGTFRWFNGWLQLGIYILIVIVQIIVVVPRQPELIAERSTAQKGTKTWDYIIGSIAASLMPMAAWIVSGLDFRHGWSDPMPLWLVVAGVLIWFVGYGVTINAMLHNPFFSATVRIQGDRGQEVQTEGPYAIVRHPGYVGAIIFQLITPFILGSWWAMIPCVLSCAAYIVRTAMEDQTLQDELEGYTAYTRETRYRLIPGIW